MIRRCDTTNTGSWQCWYTLMSIVWGTHLTLVDTITRVVFIFTLRLNFLWRCDQWLEINVWLLAEGILLILILIIILYYVELAFGWFVCCVDALLELIKMWYNFLSILLLVKIMAMFGAYISFMNILGLIETILWNRVKISITNLIILKIVAMIEHFW